ncbi:peptidoglycan-binding domain-containing protein [Dendronalium sp. ChiSLP03b]|uniref:peptidoglycan-binding domain-containing protein n=1 Tax=Dendronalium sp. ChiSLP03b TaxID=3075381 RepID=UPI002AD48081|nr:peptidoglycan-binding domain-containing protein [Dendronalium sp. ChiSLP03b]MDZ8202819.1 peptidoglycan-binding domain-containing protein [Dendronalium sp. ChiSLP03b]
MNDIVLLMTGVLITKQLSPSNLPKQSVIQLGNGVQKSTQDRSYQLIPTAKIAPPEFMQLNETFPVTRLALKRGHQKTLMSETQKILAKDLYSLAEFQHFQAVRVKFPDEQRLIAKQSSDEIVVAKSQKASFPSKKQLIAQQNCDEIGIAKSPRFTNQNIPNLRFGSSGLAVRILQRLLVANGYAIRVDGVFGALTESAVKAFQNKQNLTVDGIVGQRTWYFLTR